MPVQPLPHLSSSQDVLAGGGELGARMREMDWSQSPLGPVEQWPQSLKTCVRIMLTCRQPMFIWWGEQLINLYNDAYKSIAGGKHPKALGQPAPVVWREIWDTLRPRAESAMLKNEGTYDEAVLLIMERHGYPEETYYTFSYSPVPDDHGGAGGIICTNTDDTQRVIGERELALLRELAASTLDARTVQAACSQSVTALQTNRRDLPFALIYLADNGSTGMTLACASGIEAGHVAAPALVSLQDHALWPFGEVLGQHQPRVVNLTPDFGTLPSGAWEVPPRQAVVRPLSAAGDSGHYGVLIVGLSPLRQYDAEYEGFISLVAGQISASIAGALGYERRENATRVETVLESTSDAFIAVDHSWHITYANGRYRKMVEPFVNASQDLVGQSLWEHVPGLADSEAGERYRRAMTSQEPDSFEVYYDPLQIIMEVRVFPSPGMLSIYLRDITERRATEEALHDTRDRLEATLSAAEIGTWTWDIEKNEVTADRKLAQLFPMMESGTMASVADYLQHVHPDDRGRVQQDIASALEGGRPGFECDLRLIMADGSIRWVTARGRVQRDEEGRAVRFPGVVVDISARKRAEEALRSNELRLRAIFSQASTLIGIVGPDGILLDGNDAALAAANVRLEEEKGRPYWETSWWNQDAEVQARIRAAIESAMRGEASHFETIYFAGEGKKRWGDVHVTPVTDAGKLAFILVEGRDITELNEAQTALVQARDGAERASQAKDDFLASLSHELRTPLNPVLLLATEAARNSAFPKEAREDFDTIAKNVMLEARLIDDLLDLTLITRGKMPLDMGLRDAHEILRDAVSTVNMEMDNKSIALTLRLAAQEHQVWGDAVRLQQIFWNILKNAVKFTPNGGSITLSTRNTEPDHDLIIELTDSGIGMTDEELARVFDYFTQGEHAGGGGSHRFGGLGLGLAISRMLVEMHAGSIQASSSGRNTGTTISIRLATTKMTASGRVTIPREFREAVPVIVVEDDEVPSNLRILLVEDHEPTRVALAQLLKRRKHQVTTAGTVAEALAAAESNTFDLVMSDIGLPDGTGNDLMRELRSRYKLRGIALTGYGMSEDIARTHAAGFMAHLTKPISVQSLDQALLAAHDRMM